MSRRTAQDHSSLVVLVMRKGPQRAVQIKVIAMTVGWVIYTHGAWQLSYTNVCIHAFEKEGNSPLYCVHITVSTCHIAGRPFRRIPLLILNSIQKSPSKHFFVIGWQPLKRWWCWTVTLLEIQREYREYKCNHIRIILYELSCQYVDTGDF